MKYISFIIPCYNSSKYMKKCINSIIPLGEDIEILIIDDGSTKDNTLDIAKQYQQKYPKICKAIHKENGGHGDALNVGMKHSKGIFTKIVDSDDWIDTKVGKQLLNSIKELELCKNKVDLVVTNFIYDKKGVKHKKIMKFPLSLPKSKVISWNEIRYFPPGKYMLMHSLCYRTEILKKSRLVLPKHTFYVDDIYAYKPLPYVKKLIYLDLDLYHYFIGRDDQSVNEKVMIGRLEQQYRVTNIMLYKVNLNMVKSKKLYQYMLSFMSIIMTITSVFSILADNDYWINEKEKLWSQLKKKNLKLYNDLKHSPLGIATNLPGKFGRKMTVIGYKLSQRIYGFN